MNSLGQHPYSICHAKRQNVLVQLTSSPGDNLEIGGMPLLLLI